jgi:predicted ATPase/DNA-binding XRE family transcriptional regulator
MFGAWLKQRRKDLDLTQNILAHQVGCSAETLRKIESNRRRPSRQIAERLARQLSIPSDAVAPFIHFARTGESPHTALPSFTMREGASELSATTQSTSLPAWPTRLIGREPVLATVRERLLDDDVRLLTLTGAPGIGKTRLGAQIVQELTSVFADGVCFVGLAPLRDPDRLPAMIAQALGIHAADQSFQASLKTYLRDKQLLLLLDNFEHLLDAAPLVGELLAAAPRLKILVTSRARLQLYGEHEFPIPPLALPDLADLPAANDLLRCYPSVALFVARARAARPDFMLTEANAPIIADICVRLDGLPLAIELAAARSKLLTPAALLDRLTNRLDLLTGGARDLPARQRTLRDMIDWSYDLLPADEQLLLRRLGIFFGGCTIAAVAAVFEDVLLTNSEHGSQQGRSAQLVQLVPPLLERVAALVDQSLLRQLIGVANEPRYLLLETIREYALDRLTVADEIDAVQQQHAAYFLRFAEEAEPQLHGPEQAEWLDRLEQDHDNLRAALAWLFASQQSGLGLRLAGALAEFWSVRGHFSEGRSWLERFLAEAEGQPLVRAKALYSAGVLAYRQGDFALAQSHYVDSIELSQEQGDKNGIARGYLGLGEWAISQEDSVVASTQIEKGLTLYRELGDKQGIARAFGDLAAIAQCRGAFTAARGFVERSLELYRGLHDTGRIAWMLYRLGIVAYHQRDSVLERTSYEESLSLWETLGDQRGMAFVLNNLGLTALSEQAYRQAQSHWEASLVRFQKLGDRNGIAIVLTNLGDLARTQSDMHQAKICYETTLTIYKELGAESEIAMSLRKLGYVARYQGDYFGAERLFHESMAHYQRLDNKAGIGACLMGLADVEGAQQQLIRAARLLGAAAEFLGTSCIHMGTVDQINHEHNLTTIRAQLGTHTFMKAWDEGRAMSVEQAIRCACMGTMFQEQPQLSLHSDHVVD